MHCRAQTLHTSPPFCCAALQEKLARLTLAQQEQGKEQAQLALAPVPLAAGASGAACTPPPAKRAAALERELLLMEAAPRSPTQLLLPLWPDHTAEGEEEALAALAARDPPRPLPTSAELRRQLREAVAGGSGGAGGRSSTGGGGDAG